MKDDGSRRKVALVGDVGGTHARFALCFADDGTITEPVILPSERFHDLEGAAAAGLARLWKSLCNESGTEGGTEGELTRAAIAVAGPVNSDRVELTNVAWSFSIEATRRAMKLERLVLVNDLAALAWAIPLLERDASARDGARKGSAATPALEESVAAVVAVGTGLGVATLARKGQTEVVLASEGGHRDLAASNEREWEVLRRLSERFGGHVSVERAVSGQGLANLWEALGEIEGEAPSEVAIEPPEVTRRAEAGEPRAREAVELFSGWLGAFVGDLALTVGARRGIWLGGGVLRKLGDAFDREAFERRRLAKGRFEEWMGEVPVRSIEDPIAALRGLARALDATG